MIFCANANNCRLSWDIQWRVYYQFIINSACSTVFTYILANFFAFIVSDMIRSSFPLRTLLEDFGYQQNHLLFYTLNSTRTICITEPQSTSHRKADFDRIPVNCCLQYKYNSVCGMNVKKNYSKSWIFFLMYEVKI